MINEYEIITKDMDMEKVNKDEYEEITVQDFINRECETQNEKDEFVKKMFAVNIHMMVSSETFDMCMETINDRLIDSRLEKLNAIVFLSLKKKGRGVKFHPLSQDKFQNLIDVALKSGVGFGMDSCSAPKFLKAIVGHKDESKMKTFVEPCESSLFSSYVNFEGKFFPCSFCEGAGEWTEGIDVANCQDFVKDVWNHPRVLEFKKKLLECKRNCPVFEV